jgi:eukaryotic-like serine/threonine-protein kinase
MRQPGISPQPKRLISFGVFEVDLQAGELRKSGLKIKLQEQPFQVLRLLLDRAGEVVTREELRNQLWSTDTFVDFEQSLNAAVKKLRHALGDSPDNPRFVETLARRGYRFIAPVEALDLPVAQVSSDAGRGSSLDAAATRPPEPSSQLSENKVTTEAPVVSGPVTSKPHWLSRQSKLLAASLVLLLVVAFLFWWSLRRPTPLNQPLLTRLTSDSGLTTDAAISPDGKLIAFASDRGGSNLDIWVRQVAGGDPIQLTHDPADDRQPAFSPDGGQIVFRSERAGGGIYLISALGGSADRLLTPKGRNPRFSPTGDWIAFWMGRPVANPIGAQAGKIFLIPPTGGDPKQINPPRMLVAGFPIWSPDGTRLLFYGSDSSISAMRDPTSDWWVWPLAGGNPVKTGAFAALAAQNIKLHSPDPVPAPAEWIDDRVFFSAKAGDSVNLWQVFISPKNWQITGPAYRVTSGSGLEVRPSLAKTGLIVFSSLTENADIWSLPIDSTEGRVTGDPQQLTRDLAADYLPSLSADGKKLAFVSRRSGNADIWMKDLGTGKERPLTESPTEEIGPRISPDGRLVSYSSRAAGTGSLAENLYLIPAEGGPFQTLCDGCSQPWGWFPDNKLLFHREVRGIRATVGVINLATGKVGTYLESSHFGLYHATFTHDGRWITFVALDRQTSPSRLQVLVAPFQRDPPSKESGWIRVVSDQHWNDKPRWSPDGNRIYFVSDRDGFACLWSQPLEPETKASVGQPQSLYHIHQVRRSILNVGYGLMDIGVAPDKIVFNLGETTGNIWMTNLE